MSDFLSFVEELKTIDTSNKFMVSFDLVRFFSKIPLKEFIDLTVSYILEGNKNIKLFKTDLTKLFFIATSQTHLFFDGKVYDQVDGVAMGSPLAPMTTANQFLGHHENLWFNKYQAPSVHFYQRYVCDTFCLFNTELDTISFFDFLNSQHPNIKVTMEKETNKVLAFLVIFINNKDPSCLLTSMHHKATFTGLLANFFGFTPLSYKIGHIRTLVDRVYKIITTVAKFNDDVKGHYYILKKNQYPESLINRVVKSYLDKCHNSKNSTSPKIHLSFSLSCYFVIF